MTQELETYKERIRILLDIAVDCAHCHICEFKFTCKKHTTFVHWCKDFQKDEGLVKHLKETFGKGC